MAGPGKASVGFGIGCHLGDARADLSPVEFKAEASFEGGEDVASVLSEAGNASFLEVLPGPLYWTAIGGRWGKRGEKRKRWLLQVRSGSKSGWKHRGVFHSLT